MNSEDPSKETLLRRAIYQLQFEESRFMLRRNPELIESLRSQKIWILKDAVQNSSPEIVKLLIEEGGCAVNERDSNGWTALCFAVAFGKIQNARSLLECGADPAIHCPMFQCANKKRVDDPVAMVELLIEFGADMNQLLLIEGMPPRNLLSRSIEDNHQTLVEYLTANGGKMPDELANS